MVLRPEDTEIPTYDEHGNPTTPGRGIAHAAVVMDRVLSEEEREDAERWALMTMVKGLSEELEEAKAEIERLRHQLAD